MSSSGLDELPISNMWPQNDHGCAIDLKSTANRDDWIVLGNFVGHGSGFVGQAVLKPLLQEQLWAVHTLLKLAEVPAGLALLQVHYV